jgi:hypothetical protein
MLARIDNPACVGADIRYDVTTINVALVTATSVSPLHCSENPCDACRVHEIALSIVKVLPRPITSPISPPRAGLVSDLDLRSKL